jgi:hypothetical protein
MVKPTLFDVPAPNIEVFSAVSLSDDQTSALSLSGTDPAGVLCGPSG